MIKACHLYNIPVLTLHASSVDMKSAIALGVSDCIEKNCIPELVKLRLENAICRSHRFQLEKEKEINAALTEMRKKIEHDALTGLLNRAEFENRVHDFFQDNDTPEGIFLLLDVDNFRQINQIHGHMIGDRILQHMANSLHNLFPEASLVSRLGGDEFALYIPYRLDKEQLETKVTQLCNTLDFKIIDMQVSCSVGISVVPEHGEDFQTLYTNANVALSLAKRAGKSQYRFYIKDLDVSFGEDLEDMASSLLDNISDAMFVCDAVTSEIIYINNTACQLIGREKASCIGARCYQLFWNECQNCDRCFCIDRTQGSFYEEDTLMKDGKTKIHIKAKLDVWNGRKVKIHYLQRAKTLANC